MQCSTLKRLSLAASCVGAHWEQRPLATPHPTNNIFPARKRGKKTPRKKWKKDKSK